MKKTIIQLFIFLVLITLFITGCTKENKLDENSISIVATNFPSYDFARSVVTKVDENYLAPINNFTNVDIKLLIKPGMETHSFDPTPKDIIDIQNADIFIYMGGHSESWVEKILATSNKLPKKIIKLKDVVEISDSHHHHETEEEHNHNEHEEDEHFWTDSKNAIKMISTILENIIEVDNEKTNGKFIDEYKSNATSYINQINKLSSEIKNTVDNSSNKLLIFGDRFPFTYFTEEYNLDYLSAFEGCSSAVEVKTSKIAEYISMAITKLDEIVKPVINKILTALKKNTKAMELLLGLQATYNESLMLDLMGLDKEMMLETILSDDTFILLEELTKWSNKEVYNNSILGALESLNNSEEKAIKDILTGDFEYLDKVFKTHKKTIIKFLSLIYPTENFARKTDVTLLEYMDELAALYKQYV